MGRAIRTLCLLNPSAWVLCHDALRDFARFR
jgi:hypothetical protein